VLIGILATYWSWCLAMYRDVEQGMGVLESVIHVTLEGFRLPWLTTLQQLGYVANASVAPVFALTAAVLWVLWRWRPDTSTARTSRRVPAARGGR
jgi:hypothetical protein